MVSAVHRNIKFGEALERNLWESFKVDPNDDSQLENRLINAKDLFSRKVNRKGKRIDELI